MCVCGWVVLGFFFLGWSHLSADGSGVGVEIRRPSSLGLPQQGASDSRQRHRQRLVLIVCGHVGDALTTIAYLISAADVEGRIIGRAGGTVTALPPCGFGGVGGCRQLWWRYGQWGDDRPIQTRDTAGVAGNVLLRDGGAVRPILLTAVVLQKERSPLKQFSTQLCNRLHFSLQIYNTDFIMKCELSF